MSRSLNKVQLIGNLGKDPEVRSTASGTRVATLSIATSRQWKNASGESQEKTEWHRVVLWNNARSGQGLADIAERCGADVKIVDGPWGEPADAGALAQELDRNPKVKAVGVVHGETSTGVLTDPKAIVISTFALCGFAHFTSCGIIIGGISTLAPGQRENCARHVLYALAGATIATLINATVAGAILG